MESQNIQTRGARAILAPIRFREGRTVALGAVCVAAMLDHYTVTVAGLHVKAEHVILLALAGLLVLPTARSRDRSALRPLGWIPLFLAITLLASLLNAPDRLASLRHTAMVALVATGAWIAYWATDTPTRLRAAVRLLIGLGVIEAGVAFVGLAATWFWIDLGAQRGRGEILVPFGTLWEPNVLGSYLAAAGSLLLPVLVAERRRSTAYWGAAGLALILAALGLSLARAAWLGFAAGALVCGCALLWAGRARAALLGVNARNARLALVAALAALAFLAIGAPLLFPLTARGLTMRVNIAAYDPSYDPSLQARLSISRHALDGISSHPFLGNGAGSYAAEYPSETGEPSWIANLELHILYDSGLFGLGAVLAGLGMLGWVAWRGVSRPAPPGADIRPELIGLLAAGVALLVAFQATEGTWLAYPWVYVGLLARSGRLSVAYQPA